MTIARDIEKTASNWSGGAVGSGMLNRGHSDNSPSSALAVTNIGDPYDGTGNNSGQAVGSGWEQKRTHTLSNGVILWDLVGNVEEQTDWSLGGSLGAGPTTCVSTFTELPDVACAALVPQDYMSGNPSGQTAATYNSSYGLGQIEGGSGGAARRGGAMYYGGLSGIFSLRLSTGTGSGSAHTGFRCVYRP